MSLLERAKAPVSEHSFEINVLNGPKHCWSLNDSPFAVTFCSCQTNSDVYHASYSDLKCEERFLTCWRPMTCILLIIERISRNKLQRNYLQNQKHFPELLLHFWNLNKILSILKRKMIFITLIFPELLIPKNVVTWMQESCCFRTPFGSKRVKGSQTLLKSARYHFCANFPFMSNKVRNASCLFWSDLKCDDRLITRWRPITCFLASRDRSSCKKFQRNYLKNQKRFLELLFHFSNLHKNLSIF